MHNYEGTHGCYPPGFMGTTTNCSLIRNTATAPGVAQGWGWGTFILPFMDQAAMYQAMNVGTLQVVCDVPLGATNDPLVGNPASGRYIVPAFTCPTATDPDLYYACNGPVTNLHSKSNYVAVCGVDFTGTLTDTALAALGAAGVDYTVGAKGMFGDGSKYPPTRIADETDGTSQTFMIGEAYRKDADTNFTTWTTGTTASVERRPGRWFGMAADDQTACIVRQLRTTGTFALNGASFNAFASQHVGGGFFLVSDGSVRFISENGDQSTISRFGTINDSKVINSGLGL